MLYILFRSEQKRCFDSISKLAISNVPFPRLTKVLFVLWVRKYILLSNQFSAMIIIQLGYIKLFSQVIEFTGLTHRATEWVSNHSHSICIPLVRRYATQAVSFAIQNSEVMFPDDDDLKLIKSRVNCYLSYIYN